MKPGKMILLVAAICTADVVPNLPVARAQTQPATTSVQVVKPTRRSMQRRAQLPATIEPYESAALYAKTSGYVATIHVDIGDQVQKDAALIDLDVPEMADALTEAQAVLQAARAKVDAARAKRASAEAEMATARAMKQRAEAELELQRRTLERHQTLREKNAIPEQALDDAVSRFAMAEAAHKSADAMIGNAEAAVASARADIQVAKAQVAVEQARVSRWETMVAYATVRAPFDGTITRRMVDPGDFVRSAADGAGAPLLRIDAIERVRVVLDVPEVEVPFTRQGTPALVTVPVLGDRREESRITRTAVAIKTQTRTMRAEIDLDNADGRFAPGMYVQVGLSLESRGDAMMIPSRAVRVEAGKTAVWLADQGTVRSKPVELGYDDGIWAEVTDGLAGGEQIIISSGGTISPGARIIVAGSN